MPQLTTPLDDLLGSSSKVRVLRLLVSDHLVVSARGAARRVGMSLPAVLQAMEELVALGVALRDDGGHQVRLRANPDYALLPLLHELFAAEDSWTAALFDTIRTGLVPEAPGGSSWSEILARSPVVAACVFGSAARGEDQPDSDLDLLVLVRTTADAELVQQRIAEHLPVWRARFGIAASPVVLLIDRARAQYATGDLFLLEAARDARMIVGPGPLEEILRGVGGSAPRPPAPAGAGKKTRPTKRARGRGGRGERP